jgi:hypothetical protein
MSFTRVVPIAIVTLAAACGQTPTRPTVLEQPPIVTVPSSPSPPPTPASISGNWVGTFNVSDIDSDCSFFNPASASASFTQQDDRVHGTLSVVYACWPTEGGVAFDGVNDAGTLRGTTLSRGEFSGEATGTLSGDALELQITDMWNPTRTAVLVPAGVMRLHRQ